MLNQLVEAKQITLRDYSLSYNSLFKDDSVIRESILNDIVDLLDKDNKLVVIEGNEGIGKTNILLQLAQKYSLNTFTYFINSASNITSKQDYLMDDLGRQFYFYIHQEAANRDLSINESTFKNLLFEIVKLKKINLSIL